MNFLITKGGEISDKFLELGIQDFESACKYIAHLPYQRNTDKKDIFCVLNEKFGTCSTKHATLRKLALENNKKEVTLILGIFGMDAEYAPSINNTLKLYKLACIPEAHNYLKIGNIYYDFTNPTSNYHDFSSKVWMETEIEYDQINDLKSKIHLDFLEKWIEDKPSFSLEKIWFIREKCIADLQVK